MLGWVRPPHTACQPCDAVNGLAVHTRTLETLKASGVLLISLLGMRQDVFAPELRCSHVRSTIQHRPLRNLRPCALASWLCVQGELLSPGYTRC